MITNTQWRLARTPPEGMPSSDDFRFVEESAPEPGPGQMLTRTIYLSLDPYQWGRRRGGLEQPGEVCHGRTVSQVVSSRNPEYREGDFVFNTNGWQEFGLTGRDISVFNYMFPRKLDPSISPISTAVGVHGMLGLTAYSGIVIQCQPRPGETVAVSAASGGVGQVAGQLARLRGARVVGIAGRQEKCDYVTRELGFDACVSHLDADFPDRLSAACPDGIDVYFENVGGRVFEAVLPLLNRGSRISICGLASQYGSTLMQNAQEAWQQLGAPVFARQGTKAYPLFVGNFVAEHQDAFLAQMAQWLRDGAIRYKEDVSPGLSTAPAVFRAMLEGGNFGKTLVQVSRDPTLSHRA